MCSFGSEVFISSILIKRNIRLNSVINFYYISNDEISLSFLCDDGVHLTDKSMDILAGNFVNNINSTIFKRFLTQEI